MRRLHRHVLAIAIAAMLHAACARHNPPEVAPSKPSLAEYIGTVRQLSRQARPVLKTDLSSVEATDARLASALAAVAIEPTPEHYRDVAREYRRLGLLDRAYDHLIRALRLNARDARTYEQLARIWRDWGFPHLGLGDAHRAVYFAPRSASAHNTLGTLLQALGHYREARKSYERAHALDATAAYAMNNLCYLSLVEKRTKQAIGECEIALSLDATFAPAKANLALANAADSAAIQ
jgi:tetratricopeptide (TPR) repeat protein